MSDQLTNREISRADRRLPRLIVSTYESGEVQLSIWFSEPGVGSICFFLADCALELGRVLIEAHSVHGRKKEEGD